MSPRAALAGLVVTILMAGLVTALILQARQGDIGAAIASPPGETAPPRPVAPAVAVSPVSSEPVNPTTPVTVTATGGTLGTVSVTDAKGVEVQGRLGDGGHTWRSSDALAYSSTYRIVASATSSDGRTVRRQDIVTTITPREVAYPNMVPAPGAVPSVGVGQPVVFRFTQPVAEQAEVEKHLRVTTQPPQEGAWHWIDSRNVHYRPRVFWQPGTVITVSADVFGLDFGNGVYGAENRQVTYRVHDSWIARANGATQRMVIFHNGLQVKTMPISMGKQATPTHRGIHVLSAKHQDYVMDSCTYGVCKGDAGYYRTHEKWSSRISNDGEFVHENPASVSAQGNRNVSHGCINLNAENARWFYEHFGLGDVVDVVNSGGPPLPLWDLYGDWSLSWSEWNIGNGNG